MLWLSDFLLDFLLLLLMFELSLLELLLLLLGLLALESSVWFMKMLEKHLLSPYSVVLVLSQYILSGLAMFFNDDFSEDKMLISLAASRV